MANNKSPDLPQDPVHTPGKYRTTCSRPDQALIPEPQLVDIGAEDIGAEDIGAENTEQEDSEPEGKDLERTEWSATGLPLQVAQPAGPAQSWYRWPNHQLRRLHSDHHALGRYSEDHRVILPDALERRDHRDRSDQALPENSQCSHSGADHAQDHPRSWRRSPDLVLGRQDSQDEPASACRRIAHPCHAMKKEPSMPVDDF